MLNKKNAHNVAKICIVFFSTSNTNMNNRHALVPLTKTFLLLQDKRSDFVPRWQWNATDPHDLPPLIGLHDDEDRFKENFLYEYSPIVEPNDLWFWFTDGCAPEIDVTALGRRYI